MTNTAFSPAEAGSNVDELLRCLLTLNSNLRDHMPNPAVPYVIDWEPGPGLLATGGIAVAHLHPQAEHFTDSYSHLPALNAFAGALEQALHPDICKPSASRYQDVPHGRLGAVLVTEIEDPALPGLMSLPEYGEQPVRQIQGYDVNGTLVSVIQLEGGPPRAWIQESGREGRGEHAAMVDIPTVRPQLETLAWAYVHRVSAEA
ncbi:hypothetical protein RCO28_27640 [Streptomyces sp. LHD-70]|uniref:hypothetical protein n=1 Tax=Streptomyces sp. LHD-70 TaxID=3072140 RepID=UPI00280F24BA|nr:hypothetical protein [Streptomyces sp. LHD-70]MDQ8706214.1 hypothetical protein [Streptomyces sp. LHD-70]